jgi:hypothetical protein
MAAGELGWVAFPWGTQRAQDCNAVLALPPGGDPAASGLT